MGPGWVLSRGCAHVVDGGEQLEQAVRPVEDVRRLQQHQHLRVAHVLVELLQVLQVVRIEEDLPTVGAHRRVTWRKR